MSLCLMGAGLTSVRPSSAAQLSRGAAIALALKQNPQIAAARAVEAQARARQGQARAARFPLVTITAAVGPSLKAELVPGSAIESTENNFRDLSFDDLSVVIGGQLEILQPLYTFGKISERQRAASLELRARQAQTDMKRADVAFEVAELYEGMLFARDALRFFEESDHWMRRSIEHAEGELEAGTGVTEEDLLRLRTGLALLQLFVNQAQAGLSQAERGLVAYLGLSEQTRIEPTEELLELLPVQDLQLETLATLARNERPELRALRAGNEAYRALAAAEGAGNYPDFFALGFVNAAYTPGRDWVNTRFVVDPMNHFVPGLLIGARWQFTGNMASQRAAENEALASEMARTYQWAFQAIPAEVNRALKDVERARSDAKEADAAVDLAKKWMVRAAADFSIGLGSSRNVSDAVAAYLQLRVAALEARYRHNVALANLAKSTGTLDERSRFYPTTESRK